MSVHQCPKCDLRFDWMTELNDHIWHDHPEFRHEYPAWSSHHPRAGDHAEDHPAPPWDPNS